MPSFGILGFQTLNFYSRKQKVWINLANFTVRKNFNTRVWRYDVGNMKDEMRPWCEWVSEDWCIQNEMGAAEEGNQTL